MKGIIFTFTLLLFTNINTCVGQLKKDSLYFKINNLLTEIYHFKFSQYKIELKKLKANYLPDNKYYYLKANIQWWHIMNGHNNKNDRMICINYINQSVEAFEQNKNKNIEDKLTLFSAYILKMRVNNLGNHKFKSARLLLKILNLSEDLIEEMPNSEQKTFVKGVYHYFTNYAKEESIIASIFLYGYSHENKEKGLKYLEKAAEATNSTIRTEAHYLLYKIYSTLENNKEKAVNNAEWLSKSYPENIFFNSEYYLTLCRYHYNKKALLIKNILLRQVSMTTELKKKEKQHYYKLILDCKPDY